MTKPKTYTIHDVRRMIADAIVDEYETQARAAHAWSVDQSHVSRVLNGHETPSVKILLALGLIEEETIYRKAL